MKVKVVDKNTTEEQIDILGLKKLQMGGQKQIELEGTDMC